MKGRQASESRRRRGDAYDRHRQAGPTLRHRAHKWQREGEAVLAAQGAQAHAQSAGLDAVVTAHDPKTEPANLYRHQRAIAYGDEMGAETGNFIVTIGNVLDLILDQIEATPDLPLTDEMRLLLNKRADIKECFPKKD